MARNFGGLVKVNRDFTIEKIAFYKPIDPQFGSYSGFAPFQTKPNRIAFSLNSRNINDPFGYTTTGYFFGGRHKF
jgi:hypothetical protein